MTENFGNQKKLLQLSVKKLADYVPTRIPNGMMRSSGYRQNWTTLLQLTRSIQNCQRGGTTTEDILKSLVQMKLYQPVSVEVEKVLSTGESTSLDEMFTVISDVISYWEASEITRPHNTAASNNSTNKNRAVAVPTIGNGNASNRTPSGMFCAQPHLCYK